MKLLDRYIAWLYLKNIAALFVVLFVFVVGVDIFLNLKNFTEAAHEVAPENPSRVWIILITLLNVIDLWGPRLLQLFSFLIGLVLVAAMGFTLSTLVRRRELVAAMASGVSLFRLAAPFVTVAVCFVGLGLLNQEFILPHPKIAPLLHRSADESYKRSIDAFPVHLLRDGSDRLFYASSFDPRSEVMENVHVWERDANGRIERRIIADRATWDEGASAWALTDVTIETLDGSDATPSLAITTDLEPATVLLKRIRGYGQALSWRQISHMLATDVRVDDATRTRLNRIRYGRLSMASCNLLAVLIAMPFFLVREPRGMVRQTLKSAPWVIAAMVAGAIGSAWSFPGLPPQVGVFVPVMLLGAFTLSLITFVKT